MHNARPIRLALITGAVACSVHCIVVAAGQPAPLKPNILMILSDNQGWKDIGYYGSEIRTPHLDKLAATGVRLDHFYVYPMCSPTRAALISGRAPSRYGILGAIGRRSRQALPPETPTIADSMKACGYETAISPGEIDITLNIQVAYAIED